jgi:pyruvate ferredoxin oxidoreductase delta subunit
MALGFITPSTGSTREVKTGTWRAFRPVIDYDKCTKCGWCWAFCPDGAISFEAEQYVIDYGYCKGCGICAEECPVKAINMEREEE